MNTEKNKWHRHLFQAVIDNCIEIFEQNRYADKVIQYNLKQHPKWGSKDRAFVAQHTYDMVRWYRLLKAISGANEIPSKGDWWQMLAALRWWQQQSLPEWTEFRQTDYRLFEKRLKENSDKTTLMQSYPDWLDALCKQELGERWIAQSVALNTTAPVYIRVNILRIQPEKLSKLFQQQDIKYSLTTQPECIRIDKRVNLFGTDWFQKGFFEVQDIASQLVAPFLQVQPGMKVIDACAGAGGKTLHIAALLQNKGKIVAMDTENYKLDELKRRAKRAGADTIESVLWPTENAKVLKKYNQFADRILLDVPCSGLGVLRRNPDAKWKLQADFIDRIKVVQQQILQSYTSMLKPGGKLVYATCSILPSENENQVAQFLSTHQEFELEEIHHTWPEDGYDGFFMARIVKKN